MNLKQYNYIEIEKKWQQKWIDQKIYQSKKNKENKFFIHFAYPGVSGYLHVGHMRGFTYCDIIARHKRMDNYNVLYPAGFHASGIPSIGFAKKVERNDPITIKSLKDYGATPAQIQKLTDPIQVVKYFSNVYVEDYWKRFGFLIDYDRIMSTISPGYQKFIQWQFHKLKQKNLLTQKPHYAPFCPNCGPVAVDKSETDISKGGGAEIQEFTVIKFKLKDGTILPAATLRPETIFGVTNMWVNPNTEYIKIKINNETWICSKQAYQKLKNQVDNIKKLNETIPGEKLIGKQCTIPIINRKIPILSGHFADPEVATGIVMSVPAHAPYDYIALKELKTDIKPITIIDVKDLGENPAKKVVKELNIKSQNETEKLEQATEQVYKKEFHTGILNEKCGKYAGIKISEMKDQVKDELQQQKQAITMREFSEEVICRCNEKVMIKKIPDQWFIKYSDKKLTEDSKKHVEKMNIYPAEYKKQLPKVLDWFDDRACIRKGSWLGTEFPFKKEWIVEPISDSTLYPAYYIISKHVNNQNITPEEMTEEFFDYVFLGKGKPKNEKWDEIKEDFNYWYPVNINLGGKEHKTVHFPVFIMNHVAIMPENKRPHGIFVHWWVTQKGKEKISKSKGGAEHIADAAKKYGVDAMRLYYSHVGSPFVDVEWNSETVTKYKNKIGNIYHTINKISNIEQKTDEKLDHWLKNILKLRIKNIENSLNNYDLRDASNEIFFEILKDMQWYIKRGGGNQKILKEYKKQWIKLMTPFTPHIAEELWNQEKQGFVSEENYPKTKKEEIQWEHIQGEELLSEVIDDIKEILHVTKIKPKKICIYTSPEWKWTILTEAIKLEQENQLNMGNLMKTVMIKPEIKSKANKASKYSGKLMKEVRTFTDKDKQKFQNPIDEKSYIKNAENYLKELFHAEIQIYNTEEKEKYDPENKSNFAVPLKPGIYIE